MAEVVLVARCHAHGFHSERTGCYVCGGPVEQVAMVRLVDHKAALERLTSQHAAQRRELTTVVAEHDDLLARAELAMLEINELAREARSCTDRLAVITDEVEVRRRAIVEIRREQLVEKIVPGPSGPSRRWWRPWRSA